MGRLWKCSRRTWSVTVLVLSLFQLFGTVQGEDCLRDGYYQIPRFGDSCQYRCRCVNEEQCDRVTGHCQNGCAYGWMGPGCQFRNTVILNNGTTHSSFSFDTRERPSLAIDNDHSTCSKSYNILDAGPWWQINFHMHVYVVGIIIHIKDSTIYHLDSLRIEGSDHESFETSVLCYQHHNSPIPRGYEIMCRQAMAVRHIRFTASTTSQTLELCEVEIYGGRYVSYKAPTEHSSYFFPWHGVSSKAVDGRPMLEGDKQEEDGARTCSSTNKNTNEYWRIILFDQLMIEGINVYSRRLPYNPEYIGQIQRFIVYVKPSGVSLWKRIFRDEPPAPYWTDYQPLMIEVANPELGATVMIKKYQNIDHLSLCEVEIFAECEPGSCGWNCSGVCHCSSRTTGSVRLKGLCPYGCKDRWIGKDGKCDTACADNTWGVECTKYCNCFNGEPCDFVTGTCPNGCSAGWKPSASCNISCDAYTYGHDCTQTCGHCSDGDPCNATDGHCHRNCKPGWKGPLCKEPCADHYYGHGCNSTCGACAHGDPCLKDTGYCKNGCVKGFLPPMCQKECPDNTYGLHCGFVCGRCKDNVPCDKFDGHCPGACAPGWKGSLCKEPCADYTYGPNCSSLCGNCTNSVPCDKPTGVCSEGCDAGFKGSLCIDRCEIFTYGENCINQCGQCQNKTTCNITTGYCPGNCEPGYTEPYCKAQPLEDSTGSSHKADVIAPIVSVAVLIALIAIILVIVMRKRSRRGHKATEESKELDVIPTDNGLAKGSSVTALLKSDDIAMNDKISDKVTKDETSDNVYVNSSALSEPIPISQLKDYCHKIKLDPSSLIDDFKEFPLGLQFDTTKALKENNRSKNRYRDLYPYDKNAVILPTAPGFSNSDYINASHIDGVASPRRYIAAQGAMKNTVDDVWRMIWAHDIATIVMLTGCYEQGRNKCEQYWPDEDNVQFGDMQVTSSRVDTYADHITRNFTLQKKGTSERKHTTQYHFTGWPDKDVPDETLSLVQFWRIVKQSEKAAQSPWMVHCSAGIGRTGTFIAIDYLYDQGKRDSYMDIKRCVHQLRDQRVNMVQTKDQYLFVHQAVHEALNPIGTICQAEEFSNTWRELQRVTNTTNEDTLFIEYMALTGDVEDLPEGHEYATFNSFLTKDDFSDSKLPDNARKSHNPDILPPNRYRPRLALPVEGHNDYINAVLISTFRKKDGIILSQLPLENTVVDCLRLIWQYKINTVVVMEKQVSEVCNYCPATADSIEHAGPFSVELLLQDAKENITTRTMKLRYTGSDEEREIRQFHLMTWEEHQVVPNDHGSVLNLISEVESWYRTSDSNTSILVHCRDGATRTGLFCVLWSVLERVKSDRTVAIAETVRMAMVRRKQIIPSYEQYQYCWKTVNDYLEGMEVYGNVM